MVIESLSYLAEHHPRHYKQIQQKIKSIVNGGNQKKTPNTYLPDLRFAQISYTVSSEFFPDRELRKLWLCAQLIHMATLGRLVSLRMAPTRRYSKRITLLCFRQEYRFLVAVSRRQPLPEWLLRWYHTDRYGSR